MGRALLRIFASFAVLPFAACLYLVLTGGPSWSAVLYMLAGGVVLAGLVTLPFPEQPWRRRRGLTRAGLGLVVATAVAHACTVGNGRTLEVLDGRSGSARILARLVEEPDVAIAAARALYALRRLHDDGPEMPVAMRAAYATMREEEGHLPAPFLPTNLGRENPSGFDLALMAPPDAHDAIVFLHGSAGNFLLPCWQVARAVRPLGVATACPSTVWSGDWGTADGEAIVRQTLALLRARGLRRFVLVGLSAGGYGASVLAPRLRADLAGLLLLSGAEPTAPAAGVPTLLVHGTEDTLVEIGEAEEYATTTGAELVRIHAGHFALLVHHDEVAAPIRRFVAERFVNRNP